MKIGFADWYLDNWHCNEYPGFLRDAIARLGLSHEVTHACGMRTAPSGVTSADWCRARGVKECGSMEELADSVDAILVIAADDARTHETVSAVPLSSGKPVFVDKTFAYTAAEAERMFALAERNGTPVFSSSAQRYCQDVIDYKASHPGKPLFVSTVGPHSLDRYAVHQLEVIEALMGPGIRRLKAFSAGNAVTQLILDYGDGRWASFMQTPQPWAEFNFMVTEDGCGMNGKRLVSDDRNFYFNLMKAILGFFETREPPVPHEETMEIVRVIEAAREAREHPDIWYSL